MCKAVRKYSLEGKLVAEYHSLYLAAKENDLAPSSIATKCKRVDSYKPLGGFIWRYAENDELSSGVDKSVLEQNVRVVRQYDLDGKLIATFESVSEAARKTGLVRSTISECCARVPGHYTAGGFIWRRADDDELEANGVVTEDFNPGKKPVCQYTVDGEFVAKYPSIIEAEEATGFSRHGISACANGRLAKCHGFVWKFADRRTS